MKPTTRSNPFTDYWMWALAGPLFVCVIFNALVRPYLAKNLGGEQIRSGASVRGSDRWWTFTEQTRSEHPWLTDFLTLSDGKLAMLTFALIAVLFAAGGLIRAMKHIRGRNV